MIDTLPPLPWATELEGLPLTRPTDPSWFAIALGDLNGLLSDHAHCEQKAASVALSLIGRFPEDPETVRAMLALAHEEMRHFRQVLDRLEARGGRLTKPLPDRYVQALRDWAFRSPGGIGARVDLYLASAFVEARSCERFRILAAGLLGRRHDVPPDGETDATLSDLGTFYLRLADAESRHWEMFRDLSLAAASEPAVRRRLDAMAEAEAAIVADQPLAARMH